MFARDVRHSGDGDLDGSEDFGDQQEPEEFAAGRHGHRLPLLGDVGARSDDPPQDTRGEEFLFPLLRLGKIGQQRRPTPVGLVELLARLHGLLDLADTADADLLRARSAVSWTAGRLEGVDIVLTEAEEDAYQQRTAEACLAVVTLPRPRRDPANRPWAQQCGPCRPDCPGD
jgi:hypothetical protein